MSTNISTAHSSKYRLLFPYLPFLPDTESGKIEKGDSLLLYCSEVSLPNMDMEQIEVPNQMFNNKFAGGNINYGNLEVVYSLDENFTNYKFLWNWMMYLKNPETFGHTEKKVDATLMIYTNNDNPKFKFILKDIFPISIDGINFNKKTGDVEDMENTTIFSLSYYLIEEL